MNLKICLHNLESIKIVYDIKQNNMKFISVVWFNQIGVVKCEDLVTGETKFYIGNGQGFDEKDDIKFIMSWVINFILR